MNISFGPRGILQIDDARIIWPNFEGRETMYNRKGDRNFSLIIEDADVADKLASMGWNIKIKPGRDADEPPFMRLDVKIKYTKRDDGSVNGPKAYLWSGRNRTELDEDSIGCLDHIDRGCVNLDIRPYDWNLPSGKSGRSAYLQSIEVYQNIDRFQAQYESMNPEEKLPF